MLPTTRALKHPLEGKMPPLYSVERLFGNTAPEDE